MDAVIVLLIVLLIGLVAVAATGHEDRVAARERARQEQHLARMEQVKDATSQQIRELNRAYRARVAKAAREQHRRRMP